MDTTIMMVILFQITYLTEFYAKKTDSWQTNLAYDLITNKLEDWEFEYYWN